jgi:phage tail sheath gpL-like
MAVVSRLGERGASRPVANTAIGAGVDQGAQHTGVAEVECGGVHQRCEPRIILAATSAAVAEHNPGRPVHRLERLSNIVYSN